MSAPILLQPPITRTMSKDMPKLIPMTSKAVSQHVGPADIKSYFQPSYVKRATIDLGYGLTKTSPGKNELGYSTSSTAIGTS